ncbi:hypothetical protein predicted by Glimmer/Critica [Corynebacterium glutamicum ATCC 13032]|nr:hypothetical protein predicted by Glimmer/Critica [Corynebacterium glutamicum ATCC 13032]
MHRKTRDIYLEVGIAGFSMPKCPYSVDALVHPRSYAPKE